jgi:hypothetical protein
MDRKYICYCGLYCGNCRIIAKINPAAKVLYDEMIASGLESVINFIPGGDGFWPFLKDLAEDRTFTSCIEGCGDPSCAIRLCAKEKGIEMCAMCVSYPCGHFNDFLKAHPLLEHDNSLLREKGFEAWSELQDDRRARGFVYWGE